MSAVVPSAVAAARWEVVFDAASDLTERLRVPGGWLYRDFSGLAETPAAVVFVPEPPEELASRIARALFTCGSGVRAERLVLEQGVPPRDLGGWSETAAREQIARVLRGER